MAESVWRGPSPPTAVHSPQVWIRRLVWKMAIATWLLMAIGSATRVMNAGLACPDWPLCYGQWIPSQQMNLQVFLEWFHRLDASLIGLSAIALVGLSLGWRKSLPAWLPWASVSALGLILLQGLLGGLTVTALLRFDIVTAHLATALLFFCTLIAIGCCLLPAPTTATGGKFVPWAGTAAVLVYGQSLLGGLVASRWALHQCLSSAQLCWMLRGHLWFWLLPTLAVIALAWWSWRTPALPLALRRLTLWAIALIALQIFLGWGTYRLHLQVEPLTIAHQSVGAALLGVLVAFGVIAHRDRGLMLP